MAPRPTPHPGTLIDLAIQLRRDEALPQDTLRSRDRAIGQRLGASKSDAGQPPQNAADRAGLATAWLDELDDPPRRGGEALGVVGFVAVGLGLLLGYGAAMALFYYDGQAPVNVVRVLAVFVALQVVTLLLFALAAAPGSLPGGRSLRALSPGRLAALVARWLPGETRDAVAQIVGRGGAHQRVYGRVQKWQVLAWSQAMALAFNVAALGGSLQLIVFSDLAFGWSTTLQVDEDAMYAVTSALSKPWETFWADAVPTPKLVAETRTNRVEALGDQIDPATAAGWWPFLVACIAVYGVLPRVVTLILTRWRLRRAAVRAVAFTPGVDRLCDRLGAALVETRAAEHEADGTNTSEAQEVFAASAGVHAVIRWADAPHDGEALHAGGGRALDDDRRAIAEASRGEGVVRVVVKAWEPPVLELLDFLGDLRKSLGDGRAIEVQPVGEGDRAVWRKKLASVGDPWLRLVDPNTEGASA